MLSLLTAVCIHLSFVNIYYMHDYVATKSHYYTPLEHSGYDIVTCIKLGF